MPTGHNALAIKTLAGQTMCIQLVLPEYEKIAGRMRGEMRKLPFFRGSERAEACPALGTTTHLLIRSWALLAIANSRPKVEEKRVPQVVQDFGTVKDFRLAQKINEEAALPVFTCNISR
jgi:hypothetical protein